MSLFLVWKLVELIEVSNSISLNRKMDFSPSSSIKNIIRYGLALDSIAMHEIGATRSPIEKGLKKGKSITNSELRSGPKI